MQSKIIKKVVIERKMIQKRGSIALGTAANISVFLVNHQPVVIKNFSFFWSKLWRTLLANKTFFVSSSSAGLLSKAQRSHLGSQFWSREFERMSYCKNLFSFPNNQMVPNILQSSIKAIFSTNDVKSCYEYFENIDFLHL